jgi:hypothetical protein
MVVILLCLFCGAVTAATASKKAGTTSPGFAFGALFPLVVDQTDEKR